MPSAVNRETTARRESKVEVSPEPLLVEVGWLMIGDFDAEQRRAIDEARSELCERLGKWLPQFTWRMPLQQRETLDEAAMFESAHLLEAGVEERNIQHWDYTVVITSSELASHYKPQAMAMLSRSLESIVISIRRIQPDSSSPGPSRHQRLTQRLVTLVLHALGHHAGLSHHDEPTNYMADLSDITHIDQAEAFTSDQLDTLQKEFAEVADSRLEETPAYRRANFVKFYARSAWMNRREIVAATVKARPWEFPYRLSRLTAAAISATLVLFLTAEAWELAAKQSAGMLAGLSVIIVVGTTIYVLLRQRLLLRRRVASRSEQTVLTNLCTVAIVFFGIVTTFACLMLIAMAAGWLLFSGDVIRSWTNATAGSSPATVIKPATLAASLAMLVGALGATFENADYFRHVTYVDEEI